MTGTPITIKIWLGEKNTMTRYEDGTYYYESNEANFGPPQDEQVEGGAHITFEIVPRHDSRYVALRRPQGIPGHHTPPGAEESSDGLLYFVHGLIRYGEPVKECVQRLVQHQAAVHVAGVDVVDLDSVLHAEQNVWGFMPLVIANVETVPEPGDHGNTVSEVVTFPADNPPDDFGWWTQEQLKQFLAAHT